VGAERNRLRLRQALRYAALRTIRGYRTVSTDAVEVLASSVPGDLLVEEARRVRAAVKAGVTRVAARARERAVSMERWQERWSAGAEVAQWTRALIVDVRVWSGRSFGECTHWLTQLLSGHGCFGAYRHKIGKEPAAACAYCAAVRDDARHVLLECPRWEADRALLGEALGEVPTAESLVALMMESDEKWRAAERFAREVLTAKDGDDRARDVQRVRPNAAAPGHQNNNNAGAR
jgi:hypothetical protein